MSLHIPYYGGHGTHVMHGSNLKSYISSKHRITVQAKHFILLDVSAVSSQSQ